MIKLLGAVLVVTASTGYGLWKAGTFTGREIQLRELLTALQMLETEIEYAATPLPEALERIGTRIGGSIGRLLSETGRIIVRGEGLTAGEILRQKLTEENSRLHLKSQDHQILTDFAHTLGNSDRIDQIKHVRLAVARLNAEAESARDETTRLGRMWRYLGALLGLAAVIIMF